MFSIFTENAKNTQKTLNIFIDNLKNRVYNQIGMRKALLGGSYGKESLRE